MNKCEIYTDGASRGNPGDSAVAYVLTYNGKIYEIAGRYIGEATNNTAEYMAIIDALIEADKRNIDEVDLYSDSELVISQLNGTYKIKEEHLRNLFYIVKGLIEKFDRISFHHVPRTCKGIQMADNICNTILDAQKNIQNERIEKEK